MLVIKVVVVILRDNDRAGDRVRDGDMLRDVDGLWVAETQEVSLWKTEVVVDIDTEGLIDIVLENDIVAEGLREMSEEIVGNVEGEKVAIFEETMGVVETVIERVVDMEMETVRVRESELVGLLEGKEGQKVTIPDTVLRQEENAKRPSIVET